MPDDYSEVEPLLPIPNRTVKRFSADDSADTRVKVGHRQAITTKRPSKKLGRFYQNYKKWSLGKNVKVLKSLPALLKSGL